MHVCVRETVLKFMDDYFWTVQHRCKFRIGGKHTSIQMCSPIIVVAAPAAAPATIHLLIVGSSNLDSMKRPTIIHPCILKAFSGMIPNVRDTTPVYEHQ